MGLCRRLAVLIVSLITMTMVSLVAVRYYGMYHLADFAALASLPSSSPSRRWSTFSGVDTATAAAWYQPRTVDELVAIVTRAREQRLTVKVVGAGHSWSPVALPNHDGIIVNMDHISSILDIDYSTLQVSVEAGIRVRSLSQQLWQAGLSLVNHGVVSEQSLAGALMTGTHGTGITFLPMSSQIVSMDLLLANGTIVHLSWNHHPHIFTAARLSLGTLGIMVRVTLQCVTRYHIKRDEHEMPLNALLATGVENALISSHDHFTWLWLPYTNYTRTLIYNRYAVTPLSPLAIAAANKQAQAMMTSQHRAPASQEVPERDENALWKKQTMAAGLSIVMTLASWLPAAIPILPSLWQYIARKGLITQPRVISTGRGYDHLLGLPPGDYHELEYYIELDRYMECFGELRTLVNARTDVNFVIQTRYLGIDDHLLTLSAARTSRVAAVAIMSIGQPYHRNDTSSFFNQAEQLFQRYGGLPHWGKIHNCNYDYINTILGDRLQQFLSVRRTLDPDGMFLNQHTRTLFNVE